jgi:hypothetical protein
VFQNGSCSLFSFCFIFFFFFGGVGGRGGGGGGAYSTMMHNRGLLLHKTYYKLLNLPSLSYHDDFWHWHFSR